MAETLLYRGFWHMARRHWRSGLAEMYRSLSTQAASRALQAMLPDLRPDDLVPAGAGVRAQAVDADGRLLDDFRVVSALGMVHVLNAPSPAATAALAIGEHLSEMANAAFRSSR